MVIIPEDSVVVSHYSDFHEAMIYQLMPVKRAKELFNSLSMNEQSRYTIRPATVEDFDAKWPKIVSLKIDDLIKARNALDDLDYNGGL